MKNIEDSYLEADEYLRKNLRAVKTALKGARGRDRSLILATGAMSIIYAKEMYGWTLEETMKSISSTEHPAIVIKAQLNAYLDDVIERYNEYVKTRAH